MKRAPDEIDILGKPWQLINSNKYCKRHGVYGLTDDSECRIYYSTRTTPSQIRDTVLHEVIHALDLSLHLELSEQQVHAIAASLFGTFMNNTEFTQWLLSKALRKDNLTKDLAERDLIGAKYDTQT